MNRNQWCLFLIAGLALAMACGPTDSEDERDYPDEIAGELTSVSPGTVRGDTPEPITVDLRVDDSAAVKQLLDDGAQFEISLRDSAGEEMIAVDEIVRPDGDEDGVFELRFAPGDQHRKAIRKQLQVRLALDDEGQIYAWGSRSLGVPEDVGDLDVDERQASRLEGLANPLKVWPRDLDGDGIDDLVVLDSDGESRRLVVFRCDDGTCSNEGEVALSTDGDIGGPYEEFFEIPDLVASPDDDSGAGDDEPFVIAYPSLFDAARGEVREAEHLVIRLVEDGDDVAIEEQRTQIALPSRDETTWLAETMKPRLLQNPDTGDRSAAISIITREESSGDVSLNHALLQESVEPIRAPLHVVFEGLDDQGRQAALHGQISTCLLEELYQDAAEIPDGRLVSIFEYDGATMAAVGSLSSPDQMIAPRTLPESLSGLAGDEGIHARCKLVDLDADGHLDLAFSVSTDQGQALLVALSDSSSDSVTVGEPQLVMAGLSDAAWDLYRDVDDELRLVLHRSGQTPPPGEQPEITHEIGLEANIDGGGTVTVTVSNQKPTVSGLHVNNGDSSSSSSVVRAHASHQLMSIDHRDRESFAGGISSVDVGGLFLGSEQLVSSGGMWIAAHFSGGIVEGDEASLLQMDDPKSIIGWLSTTGPFLPLSTETCCNNGQTTPVIITELPRAADDDDSDQDDAVEAHVVHLVVNDDGEATGLRLQDLATVDGEPQIADQREVELDFSATELASKNVVKFKAGAELSKTASASDGDDECPDTDGCPAPSSTTLLFVMDSGEMATAELSAGGGMGKVSIQELPSVDNGDRGSDAEEFFFDSLGQAPVLGERRPPLGVDVWESAASRYTDTDLSQGQGEDRQVVTRSEARLLVGDFQGLGHPQILEMTLGDDDGRNELTCKSNHLSMGGGDGQGQGDLDSIDAALDRQIQSVCLPENEAISIVDIDGDRCQDVVFPESRRALLSRCDGTFESELVELGNWSGHLGDDDGWVPKAQDYNSSRSNKPSSIQAPNPLDPDDDGDGIDDEVIIVCPFVDGLQRVR